MADTIRILVSTDNHVGYAERDPIRGDDSWKTFHEIMGLAKARDVDAVLLGGDLFHENKPSRKSMYNVMRSLRLNCYGDKPCELELLSDGTEHFDSTIGHANYEDPDINVAIPVFSIHGNHDDPSGEGLYAALDILEMAGLINYFGRVPESDNITVRPLCFQKGSTKLALYGLSNVRDERLHRTFRDGRVVFKRPGVQQQDWFNLMVLHQNHHAHTETSYLPEAQLPDYMDLVIWGHEHECDRVAHRNPEKNFKVLQPGSSIATSLIPGEAKAKHVFIIEVTGRDFKQEDVRLQTVRPLIYKDIVLRDENEAKRIAKKNDHRSELTRYLEKIVRGLIAQAQSDWEEAQKDSTDNDAEQSEIPLPIVRLRIDTTSPDGGATRFDVENPQRFSQRFTNEVANRNDVVQFITRKRNAGTRSAADTKLDAEALAKYQPETIKVDVLVKDFLTAQSLTILPTNYFSDAVHEFIIKDDKHAMASFVDDALANQVKDLLALQEDEDEMTEETFQEQIEAKRRQLEELFAAGNIKVRKDKRRYKPKPDDWDSDMDGNWEDHPLALVRDEVEENDSQDEEDGTPAPSRTTTTRGRGRGKASRAGSTTATATRGRGRGRGVSKAAVTTTSRSRRAVAVDDDEDDEDVIMIDEDEDDDVEEDSQALFIPERSVRSNGTTTTSRASRAASTKSTARAAARKAPTRAAPSAAAAARSKQSTISFQSQSQAQANGNSRTSGRNAAQRVNDDIEDDDDDDDFELMSSVRTRRM